MRLSIAALVCALSGFLGFAPLASAATTTYNVSPSDLASGKPEFSAPHGTGTNPFAYDWDSAAPELASGAPSGFGSSSFYADVNESGGTQADRYRTFRIGAQGLSFPTLGGPLTLADIASITYQTNKNAPATAIDWRLTIYTSPTGSGDVGSWYHDRIQSLPYHALSLNAPANQWNTWSTDTGDNQLQFYTNRAGFTNEDLTFAELTGGTATRGANSFDFSTGEIMMFDFTMGANGGGGTGISQLDAITITLTNGDSVIINAVPEPSSLALAAVGMVGVVAAARRKRRAAVAA